VPFAGADAGGVATRVQPVAATAVKAMIRVTPILLITPDMTGTLRRLGGQSGRSKPVGTSFIWRLHPAQTQARAIRFPARRCGFPGPAFMCPGSAWTAHRVFASLRDAQVVCAVVGCGLRVEVDSVQCCVFPRFVGCCFVANFARCDAATM
jgi:hypothetical protein